MCVVRQFFTKHVHAAEGVCARTVHLVDETNSGNFVALHLAIDGNRLRLNAGDRAKNKNCAVQNAQRAFHFDRKIHVARSINQVDVVALPLAISGS